MAKPDTLYPGSYYHIYNRGNNREAIFREGRNYRYFLRLYGRHVAPACDTFAYCLLGNHFHFLVRIAIDDQSKPPSQRFANLFNAYAKGFNKAYNRTGALFQRPFGRIEIASQEQLVWLVIYIHQNPEKHGLIDDYRRWPHSSYRAIIENRALRLLQGETASWFGGPDGFRAAHEDIVGERPPLTGGDVW